MNVKDHNNNNKYCILCVTFEFDVYLRQNCLTRYLETKTLCCCAELKKHFGCESSKSLRQKHIHHQLPFFCGDRELRQGMRSEGSRDERIGMRAVEFKMKTMNEHIDGHFNVLMGFNAPFLMIITLNC
jgi:hypothetical protein